tara:strand:- start:1134 stop:1319 length:186 start_codon:yes stop_codon:yes gene_type:complete
MRRKRKDPLKREYRQRSDGLYNVWEKFPASDFYPIDPSPSAWKEDNDVWVVVDVLPEDQTT